jgi:thiamine-monophosphate kinase
MSQREFDEIAALFRPLSRGRPEALELLDDAAVLLPPPGVELVLTKDAIVQGVHALLDETPAALGCRLLRVNLSDLAAKGARPDVALLAVGWPEGWKADDRAAFAAGLGEDLERFGVALIGGDTVVTPGPFHASMTLIGHAPVGTMVRRSGARAGDRLLVSGTIGDSWLGLQAARGEGDFSGPDRSWLAARYRFPEPRLDLVDQVRSRCSAAADVSDGLLADAGQIARASGVGCRIDLERLPLSDAARRWVQRQPDETSALLSLATGGDDYEIVAAAGPDAAIDLLKQSGTEGRDATSWTMIGEWLDGEGVVARHRGHPVPVTRAGWSHL